MNVGTIFLCLLIGAVIGFEFGRYIVTRKLQEFLKKIGDEMQQAAEKQKEAIEQRNQNTAKAINCLMSEMIRKNEQHKELNKEEDIRWEKDKQQ